MVWKIKERRRYALIEEDSVDTRKHKGTLAENEKFFIDPTTSTWQVGAGTDDGGTWLDHYGCEPVGGTSQNTANYIVGSWFTFGSSGKVRDITIGRLLAAQNAHVKCALYRKSDNTLIGETEEKYFASGFDEQGVEFLASGDFYVEKNVDYYICVWADAIVFIFWDSGATDKGVYKSLSYDDFPSQISWDGTNNHEYGILCYIYAWDIGNIPYAGRGLGANEKLGSGFRFTNVTIPQGATITSAYFKRNAQQYLTGTVCNTRIHGEKSANPSTFSNNAEDFWSRPRTSAYVNWDNLPGDPGESPYWRTSPPITSIIQEIVNMPDFQSGNAVVLFWDDFDNRSDENAYREARGYESGPETAAKLEVTWTPPPPVIEEPIISPPLISPHIAQDPIIRLIKLAILSVCGKRCSHEALLALR